MKGVKKGWLKKAERHTTPACEAEGHAWAEAALLTQSGAPAHWPWNNSARQTGYGTLVGTSDRLPQVPASDLRTGGQCPSGPTPQGNQLGSTHIFKQ